MGRTARRVRGALGMGLAWGIAWALGGLVIGASSVVLPFLPWDAFFRVFDAPLPALALPGAIGGALFSIVLGVAGRRRRFEDLSLARFTAWGAAAGVLLAMIPVVAFAPDGAAAPLPVLAAVVATLTAFCAASAAGTLALARRGARPRPLASAPEPIAALAEPAQALDVTARRAPQAADSPPRRR